MQRDGRVQNNDRGNLDRRRLHARLAKRHTGGDGRAAGAGAYISAEREGGTEVANNLRQAVAQVIRAAGDRARRSAAGLRLHFTLKNAAQFGFNSGAHHNTTAAT